MILGNKSNKGAQVSMRRLARKLAVWKCSKSRWVSAETRIARVLEWVDFAGNGVQPPIAPISAEGLTFPNFFVTPGTLLFQPKLIFPIPCEFIAAEFAPMRGHSAK